MLSRLVLPAFLIPPNITTLFNYRAPRVRATNKVTIKLTLYFRNLYTKMQEC